MRTRIAPNTDTFHAVIFGLIRNNFEVVNKYIPSDTKWDIRVIEFF